MTSSSDESCAGGMDLWQESIDDHEIIHMVVWWIGWVVFTDLDSNQVTLPRRDMNHEIGGHLPLL
jgi:hypothetical protein